MTHSIFQENVLNSTSRAMPVLFAFLCTKTMVLGVQFDLLVPAATAAVLLVAMVMLSRRTWVEGVLARHVPTYGTAPFRGAFAVVLIMGLLVIKVSVPPSYGVMMPILLIVFSAAFVICYLLPGHIFKSVEHGPTHLAPRPMRPSAPSIKDLPAAQIDPGQYPWHRPFWLACQIVGGLCIVTVYVHPAFLPSAEWANLTRFFAGCAGLVAAYIAVWALFETRLKRVPSLRPYTSSLVFVGLISGISTGVLLHPLMAYTLPHVAHLVLTPDKSEGGYQVTDTEIFKPIQKCRRHTRVANTMTPNRSQWFCADGILDRPAPGDSFVVTGRQSWFGLSVDGVAISARGSLLD